MLPTVDEAASGNTVGKTTRPAKATGGGAITAACTATGRPTQSAQSDASDRSDASDESDESDRSDCTSCSS